MIKSLISSHIGILIVFGLAMVLTHSMALSVTAGLVYAFFKPSLPPFNVTKPVSAVSIDEAYQILGLHQNATKDDVVSAYRSQMKRNHPDQGGSTYIASKLNEAKDVLLKHIDA